jgi:hypothetical protein
VRSASEISQPASDQPHPCLRRRTRSAYATPGDGCTNLGACDDRYTITPAPHRERARRLGVGSNLAVPAPLRGIVRTRREEYPDGYVIRIGERLRLVEWDEQGRKKLWRSWHPRDGGTPPWTPRRHERREDPPHGSFYNGARALRCLLDYHLWVFRHPLELVLQRFFRTSAYIPVLATLEQTPNGRDRRLVGNGRVPGLNSARRLPFQ